MLLRWARSPAWREWHREVQSTREYHARVRVLAYSLRLWTSVVGRLLGWYVSEARWARTLWRESSGQGSEIAHPRSRVGLASVEYGRTLWHVLVAASTLVY